MRFRRKVTEIEAGQFDGVPAHDPPGVFRRPEDDAPYVVTIHGQRAFLSPGDWIAPEPDGVHYYPIKDSVFRATYEPVGEPGTVSSTGSVDIISQARAGLMIVRTHARSGETPGRDESVVAIVIDRSDADVITDSLDRLDPVWSYKVCPTDYVLREFRP